MKYSSIPSFFSFLFFRAYGRRSFRRYAKLFREYGGDVSGVNLLSGHILSTNLTELVEQVL